ncbi:nucleotidyltransferase family protein [Henriciella sp. AS95]|uniref:nucleotidyltransferase family protein n=1 Tax=Henriciella sp. AS95 TaxID=3135782 RepID=UPI00317A4D1A
MPLSEDAFMHHVRSVSTNDELLARLPDLCLPQCYLAAGCLFQPVWNHRSGNPSGWGINDFDVFYFDDTDTSYEAEDAVIQRAARLFTDLDAKVEIRNQARVHLWYGKKFGRPIAPLTSSKDGIEGFLVACTCIGIEVETGAIHAPDGLQDLWNGILRPNPRTADDPLFLKKAESYKARWPWLRVDA